MGAYCRRNEKLRLAQTRLVVQIEFTEWTPDDHLRHAAFVGIREGKRARDVVRESG